MKHYIVTNTDTKTISLINGYKELELAINCSRQYIDKLIKYYDEDYAINVKNVNYIIRLVDVRSYNLAIKTINEYSVEYIRDAYNRNLNLILIKHNGEYILEKSFEMPAISIVITAPYCWSKKSAIKYIDESKKHFLQYTLQKIN
jgi:hypothetical protein